ncbi:MAG: hypothetical protein V4819_06555 [Verrucomicrobiota bacterium]
MNRFFGITGLLAGGMSLLWVWFLIASPWLNLYGAGRSSGPIWVLLLWGAMCVIGVGVAFAFLHCSLKGHWAALRRNAPLTSKSWRGVCGIYLLLMIAFAFPVLSGDPSGTHTTEMYLYVCLTVCSFAFGALAARRGVSSAGHQATLRDSSSC